MARTVLLASERFADMPLEELAARAGEWGYQGLDLCCWGDHFEVQRALSEPDYCQKKLDLLNRHDLTVPVVSVHRVSHAVGAAGDRRLEALLPDYVWGDGEPDGVRERAEEELVASVQAAQKLGVATLCGFTGFSLGVPLGFPGIGPDAYAAALQELAEAWQPILNACREAGLRFAAEVQPGQAAFDLYSAETFLEAFAGREEIGFTLDPAALHWQGVDPAEFVRRFGE